MRLRPIPTVTNGLRLGVNIDHVATLRQARYATMPDSKNAEPDPVAVAGICERAGAHGITAHLRADRRHILDRDIERLRESIMTKLNLELGNTPEIVDIALRILPDEVCLVPEKRQEVTTEGGLDVVVNKSELATTVKRFHAAGVRVSLFIDPMLEQIDAAAELSVDVVELHTGKLANAFAEKIAQQELERLRAAADQNGTAAINDHTTYSNHRAVGIFSGKGHFGKPLTPSRGVDDSIWVQALPERCAHCWRHPAPTRKP